MESVVEEYHITKHGRERISKRMGIPKKSVDRQFQLALNKGYRRKDLKGHIVKWMTKEMHRNELNPKEAIVFNNFLFVISYDNTLITVYPIPSDISKHINNFIIDKETEK